jgi:hypothetical protein
MSPERGAADRLNDHLDAVVTGDATRSQDIDASLAVTVERFFAADNAPAPAPGLADHLWEELMNHHTATVAHVSGISALAPGRTGWAPLRIGSATPRHNGPSAIAYFATAALLILTVLGGFVALRGLPQLMGPDQRPLMIPAIDSTPEHVLSSDAITDDIVLRATLETLGEMPSSRAAHQLALIRYRLDPGAVQPVGKQEDTGVGLNLFTIEAGQVTVEADAPVLVTRAAANLATAPDPMPSGTAIVLEAGDQLYAPSGVSFSRRNGGSDPATVLEFSISSVGDIWPAMMMPAGVTVDNSLPFKLLTTFPTVPAEASVHRRTLEPGAEIALRDLPGLELVYVEAGTLDLVFDKGGSLGTPERVRTLSAGGGTEIFGRTPERAVLANRGTEPLVLLTASVVPTSAAVATPQAP